MIYLIADLDYSCSEVIAMLSGPDGMDLEILFKNWYTKNVLDVIGGSPTYDERMMVHGSPEFKQWGLESQAHHTTLLKT